MEKQEQKSSIFNSYKLMWSFMGKREKVTFICIFLFSIVSSLTRTYIPLIPSLIVAKLTNEQFLIFGFIDFSSLDLIPYIIVVCAIAAVLWVFGMLHYRMIDIFARRMMCIVNEKSQEIILQERKNLDFGITTGETNYILKSASDNIYNLIEPFCWRVFGNILSLVFITFQVFTINVWAGLFELLLIVIILVCVYLRTKIQKGVVDKIEVQNAKIGNHFLMSLTNLPMITMLKSKYKELKELKKLNDEFYKENVKRANIGFWYWVIVITLEYVGLASVILLYISTSKVGVMVAGITTLISMTNEVYGLVEGWGYLINDLQVSSIKLNNLLKVYPKEIIEKEEVNDNVLNKRISSLQVLDYKVKIDNFKKTYNQVFVSGNIYVISGQSGQGKTTLVNAICGLREIESGSIVINNKYTIKNMYEYRDKISYLFQDSLLFDRSVVENIAYPNEEINDKAKKLIDVFNIEHLVSRDQVDGTLSTTLSGGEKKRIDIVRTISKDSDIYLFDEPTNELDPENVERVLEQIKKLAKENKIIIIVSHDKRCVAIADHIVKL